MKLVRIFFVGVWAIIFCQFLPLASTKKLTTLTRLDDFVRYAGELPELTSWRGRSWSNPDFEETFFLQRPGIIAKMLDVIGIRPLEWRLDDLRDIMTRVISQMRKKGPKKETIMLPVADGVRSVIWGDLHGAFHSFIRDLQELERQGLIDKNLHITDGCNFVLLGDIVNRSPYALQQLSLIATLLEKNPDHVYILASKNEQLGFWKNFLTMRQPLFIYNKPWWESSQKKQEAIEFPLERELTEFFDLLPDILVFSYSDSAQSKIYCSQASINKTLLTPAATKALIVGDTSSSIARAHSGLNFIGYDYGVTYWSLVSSPIQVHQEHLGFYYDSFVILTPGKSFRDALLAHYFRDIRAEKTFQESFADLCTGVVRLTEAEIRVFQKMPLYKFGSMVALFGGYGASGVPIKSGIEAAAIQLNDHGGVNGTLLYPVVLDDEYEGRLASINARRLTDEYGIDVFVSPQGTPTLNAYLDRVKNGEIAVLFPRSGANQFYDKNLKYLVNDLASVGDEVYALMDQMVNEFMIRTFAFVYPEDSFGLPFMETVRAELKKYGITKSFDVTYQHGQTDFTDQIKKMRESTDEGAGIFITGNAPVREFLSGLGMEFFLSKSAFATSFLDSVPFNQFINERGIRFTMSYPIPDPRAVSLPIFDNFYTAIKPYNLAYNASLFEGYLAVKLFADALTHIEPPFTKEKILGYFEGLKDYNFEGIDLTFNPEKRDIGMPVFIMTSEDRWVKYQNRHKVAEGEFLT